MEKFDPENIIEARWCVDSESGCQYLVDLRTSKILAKWPGKHKHEFEYNAGLSNKEMDVYRCFCGEEIDEFTDCGGGC